MDRDKSGNRIVMPISNRVKTDTPHAATEWTPDDERRRRARYNCVGVAEIRSTQGATAEFLTGKIRNISMGGCNIETQSPLELGSQLAVTLQASLLRLRVIAEVRSIKINEQYSAGLEFVGAATPEIQSRLQELIAELCTRQRL
jgi:PilZ domain-containing protein